MFTEHVFKLEMFVAICWCYSEWCISILRTTVPLVDLSVIIGLDFSPTVNP